MKIGNRYVQFNTMKRPYGVSKEEYIRSVKYWRLYKVKQRCYIERHPDIIDPETGEVLQMAHVHLRTENTVVWKSTYNMTMKEIRRMLSAKNVTRDGTILIAYPRVKRDVPLKNKR